MARIVDGKVIDDGTRFDSPNCNQLRTQSYKIYDKWFEFCTENERLREALDEYIYEFIYETDYQTGKRYCPYCKADENENHKESCLHLRTYKAIEKGGE